MVYSKGNNLLVKFSSKRRLTYSSGFFATYESVKAIPAEYSCRSSSGRRITLTETSGEIASYSYPLSYPNDVKCSWKIEAPVGHLVQLTFHSFDLQQSQDCEADYVEIKHGSYSWPTVIGKFCGSSSPGDIQVNDSNVYVDFKTDSSGKYPGFQASYKILPDRRLNGFFLPVLLLSFPLLSFPYCSFPFIFYSIFNFPSFSFPLSIFRSLLSLKPAAHYSIWLSSRPLVPVCSANFSRVR